MKLGFTGTRDGCTSAQHQSLELLLLKLLLKLLLGPSNELHHGDCRGADDEAANLVHCMRQHNDIICRIVKHPPVDITHQAYNPHYDECRAPLTHFARNRAIVDATDALVAVTKSDLPQPFGGTWYTIRYAWKQAKPVRIIWPSGKVTLDDGKGNVTVEQAPVGAEEAA